MHNNQNGEIKAGFFARLAAYAIDMIIVTVALWFVKFPLWISTLFNPDAFITKEFFFEYTLKDILFYCLQTAYFIILTYKTGSTVGKKLFNLKVVGDENEKLTLFEVVYRETIGRFLSAFIINIGYFMIGVREDKKGLHDILSDTKVVYDMGQDMPVKIKADEALQNATDENSDSVQLENEEEFADVN